jgi:hypothetical protein
MSTKPARRTRVTLRCLREDLKIKTPPVEVDLGGLDHALIDEARRVAPTAPRGQKRILSIERPLVYRLRHGRWRGATWLEADAARFWLCAGAQREEGSGEDAYEIFAALHRTERLLPEYDDRLRDELERNARIIDQAADSILSFLAEAFDHRDRDISVSFGGLIELVCTSPRLARRSGLRSRLRQRTGASSRSACGMCSSAWY